VTVSLQKDQSISGIDDPIIGILTKGTSRTFQRKRAPQGFPIACSTAVTIDLETRLLREMVEWKNLPAHPLPMQVWDMQDWEKMKKMMEKLNAIEAVFGMLNELTPKQRESFEKAVKRRPFFG
jgi:DNA-directed RNA polymerase specialized sigma24 family protein